MIRPARRGGPPPFQVMSNTWRDGASPGGTDAAAKRPAEKPLAAISPKPQTAKPRRTGPSLSSRVLSVVASSIAAMVDGGSRAGTFVASRCNRWLSGTVGRTPLSRKYVAVGLLAFVALVVLIAVVGGGPSGQQGGDPKATAAAPGDVDANLVALQVTQPGAVPPARAGAPGPGSPAKSNAAGTPRDAAKPGPGGPAAGGNVTPALVKGKLDPREKGKRYYVLGTYSVNKEDLMQPLLQYLWAQGVEVGAFNAHNSRFYQVIALQGFTREEINAGAHRKYEEALRRIGRKWKSDGGGDDLRGLYLDEHKGADVNLSITKAN